MWSFSFARVEGLNGSSPAVPRDPPLSATDLLISIADNASVVRMNGPIAPGRYEVELTVLDNDGAASVVASASVLVGSDGYALSATTHSSTTSSLVPALASVFSVLGAIGIAIAAYVIHRRYFAASRIFHKRSAHKGAYGGGEDGVPPEAGEGGMNPAFAYSKALKRASSAGAAAAESATSNIMFMRRNGSQAGKAGAKAGTSNVAAAAAIAANPLTAGNPMFAVKRAASAGGASSSKMHPAVRVSGRTPTATPRGVAAAALVPDLAVNAMFAVSGAARSRTSAVAGTGLDQSVEEENPLAAGTERSRARPTSTVRASKPGATAAEGEHMEPPRMVMTSATRPAVDGAVSARLDAASQFMGAAARGGAAALRGRSAGAAGRADSKGDKRSSSKSRTDAAAAADDADRSGFAPTNNTSSSRNVLAAASRAAEAKKKERRPSSRSKRASAAEPTAPGTVDET